MKKERIPYIFLLLWLILNIFQALYTELLHDEAYYWVYSKNPAWGYFDHPPLLAWLISVGYFMFENESGVRIFTSLMCTGTLYLIWKILDSDNLKLFAALVFSTVIIHFGGFIAVPDIPLVFFAALFFYFFKSYLKEDSWLVAGGLLFAIVGMAYSKYLGVLIVLFSILPNLKLLKRASFWGIIIATCIALIPHFYWQYLHEFPTFRYQLLDRSNVPYKIEFLLNYLLGQFLIFGPFIGFILFPAAVKFKAKNAFDKTMKWNFYGLFGFFLIQSLRGRIEPNWTVMAAVPLFYLAHSYIQNQEDLIRKVYKIAIPSLLLIFVARVYLVYDFLPQDLVKRNEIHGWDKWAADISEKAGDLPVIFHNTFQKPSKYMFYSGKFAHEVSYINYAGKEYDLMLDVEEELQGKTVFQINEYLFQDEFTPGGIETYKYGITKDFRYYNRVKIDISEFGYAVPLDTIIPIEVTLRNSSNIAVDFTKTKEIQIDYCLFWYGISQECHKAIETFPVQKLAPLEEVKLTLNIFTPKEKGEHWQFRFGINTRGITGRNSDFTKLEIVEE